MKINDWLTPENLILVEGWSRDGLTHEQIANNIGIGTTTLYRWQAEKREFRDALKRGREVADYEVENALFKRACGFEYDEIVTDVIEMADGTHKKHVHKVRKTVPPDTGAAAFWLKNRRPDQWKDKVVNAVEMDFEDLNPLFDKLK